MYFMTSDMDLKAEISQNFTQYVCQKILWEEIEYFESEECRVLV